MLAPKAQILVAEDNFVLSRVIQFNLEQAGYSVTLVGDGTEAIEQLRTNQFDLIITDYQMPNCDGAAICDFVRQTLNNSDLPIILCSAKGLELDEAKLESQWHLAGLFYKLFSIREILLTVERALQAKEVAAGRPS